MKDYIIPNIRQGANHYDMHCLVKQLYPDQPQPLFRVEGNGLRVRAPQPPAGDYSYLEQEIKLPKQGDTLTFEVTANVRRRDSESQRRYQINPSNELTLEHWLLARSETRHGFALLNFEFDSELLLMRRHGKLWHINNTIYSGVLEVSDPEKMHHALLRGICQARAFGFGLLITQPI